MEDPVHPGVGEPSTRTGKNVGARYVLLYTKRFTGD